LGDYSNNQAPHSIAQTLADIIDESRITADHESAVGSSATSDLDFVSKIATEFSSFTGNRNYIRAVLKFTVFGRPKNFCGMGFSTKNPCFHKTPLALHKEQAWGQALNARRADFIELNQTGRSKVTRLF